MKSTTLVIILCTVFNKIQSARILGLFPYPGKSHKIVFDTIMTTLAERGHQVTVTTFFPLQNPPDNYTELSMQGVAKLKVDTFDAKIYEFPKWYMRIPVVGNIIDQYFQMKDLSRTTLELCEKVIKLPALIEVLKKEYDLVIVETFNSDCMLGLLDVFNIKTPVVGLSSCGLVPDIARRMGSVDNPAYVPIITSSFTHRMSFFQRLYNSIIYSIINQLHIEVHKKEQSIIEKNFGKKITDIRVLARNISLILVNTYHVLNGVLPLVPGIVEVGGLHIQPTNRTISNHIEQFINESKDGVILFSLGSIINSTSLSYKTENMLIKVFSKLKQRVIWKHSNSSEEGTRIGRNILRSKWLPQIELLQHPKVLALVYHGGLLGIMEAIAFGKPIAVIPAFGDHRLNGAALEALGLGEILPLDNLQEENVERALHNLLSETMWHDRESSPLDTAVYWIERVIRWGNQSPLYSQAKYLSFYEYTLLDVAAFILIFLVSLFGTVFFIIKYLLTLFKSKSKPLKEKEN